MKRIEVNYKNKRRYNTGKYPRRQLFFLTWLIYVLSKMTLAKTKYKIEKKNMENIEGPYLMLSNHMYFVDFMLASIGLYPKRVNNVINIDGYIGREWLMRLVGGICTRKFSNDLNLIKTILYTLNRGDIVGIYPEARYSPCGITSFIPDSLAKLVKLCKVPVVVIIHHGNHLRSPFWNFRKTRKVPLYTTITQVLTKEQVNSMSVQEIDKVLREAFVYDDYKYQLENNIKITEPYRAEKMNKILYQCPHCLKEHMMESSGTEIYCTNCNKRWNLNEDGTLSALNGETEFTHVPDWFEWQRSNVIKEVENGTYSFEDEVEVYSLPRTKRVLKLGQAKVRHNPKEGWVLEGHYRNKDYRIIREPLEANSLHIEYDHVHIKPYDCFVINTEDDCYFCYPTGKDVITKLGFATEAIYQMHKNQKQAK